MQPHARVGVPLQHFNERPIASCKRLLEYVIKIAGWLVSVNKQN